MGQRQTTQQQSSTANDVKHLDHKKISLNMFIQEIRGMYRPQLTQEPDGYNINSYINIANTKSRKATC